MYLTIQDETPLVHLTVEMHGQLGNSSHRIRCVDEHRAPIVQDQSTRDRQIAIEPRIVENSAVYLDGDLLPAVRTGVGVGLDP